MNKIQKKKIEELFRKIGYEVEIEAALTEAGEVVNLKTEDPALLIGKDGSHLEALQLILNISLARLGEERVILDIAGWRKSKEEKTLALADKIAAEVKLEKRAKELRNIPAWLRRAVHLHLAHDKEVATYSEGEGEDRKLIIYPQKSQ